MKEPAWVKLPDVIDSHRESIERYGGTYEVLNQGALESAIVAPRNMYSYEESDLYELAGGYLYHICLAHAFADGNKRV